MDLLQMCKHFERHDCSTTSCASRALALISVLCFSSPLCISLTSGVTCQSQIHLCLIIALFLHPCHVLTLAEGELASKGSEAPASTFQITVWKCRDMISLKTLY
ncbi:hypothetical protein AMECASPLE_007736 [Ameca splendens]|uniref:Uncharacterized protein n=1 Tax=Ameca splendens TaxID=208324 RepID=A0ABV0Z9H4_9TELE